MSEMEEIEVEGALAAELVPGVMDVIEWFNSNVTPWAVVSRNCRKSITLAADVISIDLPGIVRSRDDGEFVKPHPRALLDTCRELGADPAHTLLIGDFIYDMIGARRAGMRGVLVRDKIEPGWSEWLEYSCRSMAEFYSGLRSRREIVPWEYQETAQKYGADFLRRVCEIIALVPDDLERDAGQWFLNAASLGIGSFAVPESIFSPGAWKKNPFFEPSFMGLPLLDAVRSFLSARFPLAKAIALDSGLPCVELPRRSGEIEGFLADMFSGEIDDG
jgi:predicted HAD superfamily phosphohydrolase YqeG